MPKNRTSRRKQGTGLKWTLPVQAWSQCPTLCDPTDCSPPGSSVRGILQARRLVAVSFSRAPSWIRDGTPALVGGFFTLGATREAGADTPSQRSKGTSPADTLIPDFKSLRLCNNKCLFNFYCFDHATQDVRSPLPNQGSNPHYLKWKHGVLTTGPPAREVPNKCLLFRPPCLWYFVMAALAK